MLQRVQSTLAAIRTKLGKNDIIKKLLLHDGNDALYVQTPKIEKMDNYITLHPIFEFENKEDYNQNSIINIYMTQCIPADDNQQLDGIIQINVVCNKDVWELIEDKIRPLEISNQIIKLIHNVKLSVSNKLIFKNMSDLIISKKMIGYALLFEFTDGSGENDKF